MRKLISKVLIFICIVSTMLGSFAIADETEDVSLTIINEYEEILLEGVEWNLYRVADRISEGNYELSGNFVGYDVSFEDQSASVLAETASTLANYVVTDSIESDAYSVSDESGKVFFNSFTDGSKLTNGIYLALGSSVELDGKKYTPVPMLMELASWSDENAQLVVYAKIQVEEIPFEPVDYTVTKIWEDEEGEQYRPATVTVEIYCDGEVVETVELSEENDWSYSWTDTVGCEWNVKEIDVPEYYKVVYRSDSSDYVIVNTFDSDLYDGSSSSGQEEPTPTPTPPGGDKRPQTGQLWWPVPVLALGGILLVVLGFRVLKTEEK